MSCKNPMLIGVIDWSSYGCPEGFPLNGLKFSEDGRKAYRILTPGSRSTFLESIPEYLNGSIMEIPCGSCIGCRLDYSKEWAIRCTLEAKCHLFNYFITLTYDDGHLPHGKLGNPTIVKKDVTDFVHSLRDKLRNDYSHIGVRYFGCCEYGDKTFRPHAHIIVFNCPIPDLTADIPTEDGSIIHKKNNLGDQYYYSQIVSDFWSKGMCIIADCNYNTSAYVSRYVLKKQKGESSEVYDRVLGIQAPYVFMSKKPGIGEKYFMDHIDEYIECPYIYIAKKDGSLLTSRIPRYFMKLLKKENPAAYQKLVDKAKEDGITHRSLLLGIKTINSNRRASETKLQAKMTAFNRDLQN